ncbi:hypothetical protein E6H36_08265 [Candidatus Bathyarchaeota archaeon]|nr:MAG: hypothetical protein AUJ07_09255 [Crenarchaeota archaeon 13_1_40CM_3_53_5]TMI24527.1 MAG: hypothetical protein E6H36_08265 [Candidatus Bathyarchaeota archaeon]TMI31901.1 MAG: hypothetical protein E6H29_04100 [Candidatus Bathyarchaeota archaeon]
MGSRLLLAGNMLALLATIAAFLQQLSWPNAGLLIITILTATILLHTNSKKVEARIPPALRAMTPPMLRSRERQVSTAQTQAPHLAPLSTPSVPRAAALSQSAPAPVTPKPATPPVQVEPRENLGELPTLIEKGDYLSIDVGLDAGKELVGEVSADGLVNVYVLTEENLTSIDAGEEFWSETCEEGVEESTVHFTAPGSGTWFLVVENADVKDVSASVKVRVNRVAKNAESDSLVSSFESLKIDSPR